MNYLKRHFDYALAALVIAGFVLVGAQRLSSVPLPDSDESMMLQISYEMIYHGKLAFPMKSFYGGNIENAWHSLTPVSFVFLSGFMKLFGWGLLQGRAFNLLTAALVLLMTHIVARKLFSWQIGLVSIVLMISDLVFLTRSRLVRYDMIAAAFGLFAFYLYEKAEERQSSWLFLASGLMAGAGVMSHTNVLYILCVVGALMLLRDGVSVLKSRRPYLFAAGALAAMSYEIVFAIADYQNFKLQTRRDDVHFGVLQSGGWLRNLLTEPARYAEWFDARGARIAPRIELLHVFLYLTAIAFVYLTVRACIQIKRRNFAREPRVRLLLSTLIIALFFAFAAQRKVTQYVIHLAPWFALCAAVMINDFVLAIRKLRFARWRLAKPAFAASIFIVALLAFAYGYELLAQNRAYLAQVRDPDQASFEEMKSAIRQVVPGGLCPASIASGYWWLAFPEYDSCYFAFMEASMDEPLDLNGKDYALILKPKFEDRLRKLNGAGLEQYHLLGELSTTTLGTFQVYYTGLDPKILQLPAKRFYFFGHHRGYVSDVQVAAAREVWSASSGDLNPTSANSVYSVEPDEPDSRKDDTLHGNFSDLCSIQLEPNKVYQLIADTAGSADCELLVVDDVSGKVLQKISTDSDRDHLKGLFRTESANRVRLALRQQSSRQNANATISRISIREVAPQS